MAIDNLKYFRDAISKKFEDHAFISCFTKARAEVTSVAWSKGPSESLIPYELEMSGVTPCKIAAKEPASKKNAHKHYYSNERLQKIEIHNSKGEVHEVDYFLYDGDLVYSFKQNRHGEQLWLKAVEIDREQPKRACRVDFDSEFWTFGYEWVDTRLQKILTFSSNSLPGVEIYPDYDDGEKPSALYFFNGEDRVYVYKA